jgi:uncharacterized RDD family membrane protein YckC
VKLSRTSFGFLTLAGLATLTGFAAGFFTIGFLNAVFVTVVFFSAGFLAAGDLAAGDLVAGDLRATRVVVFFAVAFT